MTSPGASATAPYYKLRYSKVFVTIELAILALILVSMVQLLSGVWMILFGLLFVLLAIRFYRTDSIMTAFPSGSAIELQKTQECLIWYARNEQQKYAAGDIKILMNRWFILIQLGRGKSRSSKLLLADSFADINHYTCFRRQLIEMYLC